MYPQLPSTALVVALSRRAIDFASKVVPATFLLGLLSGVPVIGASTATTFRKPPTRRIALALTAAATALFGWLSQPNAAVIHYTIGDDAVGAGATFTQIPSPPPTTATIRIKGSFDYDAETHIQTNVRLQVTGRLGAGDYAAVFPR